MAAFSIDSHCDRYLRSQAARAFAQSRSADRRRTPRGWHLPPTHNHCIPTDSRIPRLSENRLATFPAWVEVRLTPHPELRSRSHAIHTGCRSRGRVLRRDVAPGLSPRHDHGIELLWCLPLTRTTDAGSASAADPTDRSDLVKGTPRGLDLGT